jgi:hypothetical protein
MFGLMRSRTCRLGPEEKRRRRLHYCGTCKTLGRRYGQASRLLLDHDAVFAAELLTALSGDALDGWDSAYHARNCMRLPRRGDLPPALGYAAAMTVVLAEGKLIDRIEDSGRARWRILRRLFAPGFRRAARDLGRYGFPLDELWRAVRSQQGCENRLAAAANLDPGEALDEAAAPTARATALAFAHGATVAGRPEAGEALGAIGRAFGSLVYLLDALEDYDDDAKTGDFNAIRVAYGLEGALGPGVRRDVVRRIRGFGLEVEAGLERLPIPPERAAIFADRLRANVARATSTRRLRVVPADCAPAPQTVVAAGALPGFSAMAMPPADLDPMYPKRRHQQPQQSGAAPDSGGTSDGCCDCCECCACDGGCGDGCGSCDCDCCSSCGSCDGCGDCSCSCD